MTTPFGERLAEACIRVGVPVAVGLDPHLDRLPRPLRARFAGLEGPARRAAAAEAVQDFGDLVIDAVAGRVAALKPQVAFFEQLGAPGFAALEHLIARARSAGLLVIADAKRGDISSTAAAYARSFLAPGAPFESDALTVSPYLGLDTVQTFVEPCVAHGGGLFVLVRTTNPGSAALQHHGEPCLADVVAAGLQAAGRPTVGAHGLSSVGAVVGASAAADARRLREVHPDGWFLVPGVGAQGGTASDGLAGMRPDGLGVLPVASRSVLFPKVDNDAYDADPGAFVAAQAAALSAAIGAARDAALAPSTAR